MTADAEIGETIAGYVLEAPLGEGSTSRVFVGRHQTIGRRAAIKVVALSVMESSGARARLLQEARAVSDVCHPHIAAIWDFHESETPPRIALVMELVEGPSMRVLRGEPLEPRAARTVALQLVDAVAAAHGAGVIHRDLKPDNILFTEDPREPRCDLHLKVVDFGLAKRLGPGGIQTAANTMLGTPAYMAPEQIMGRPPPSPATDVYAVAELVYELFTGERAFRDESSQDVLQQKLRGEIPELPMPPPLDRDLQPVLQACLNPDPHFRPSLEVLRSCLDRLSARALSIPAGATALEARPLGLGHAEAKTGEAVPVRIGLDEPERKSSLGSSTPSGTGRANWARARREADVATGAVSAEVVREARVEANEPKIDPLPPLSSVEDQGSEGQAEDDEEEELSTDITQPSPIPFDIHETAVLEQFRDRAEPAYRPGEDFRALRPLRVNAAVEEDSDSILVTDAEVEVDAATIAPDRRRSGPKTWLFVCGLVVSFGLILSFLLRFGL